MKPYRITVTPAHGRAWSYVGLFADGFDAVIHALGHTIGAQVRISAKVLS